MPFKQIKRLLFGPGSDISRDLAMKVFRRDHFKCQYCGLDGHANFDHWLVLTIDHIRPRIHGGSQRMENLMTACRPCNLLKGRHTFASFEEAKKYVHAKREEWRKRYEEQTHAMAAHA